MIKGTTILLLATVACGAPTTPAPVLSQGALRDYATGAPITHATVNGTPAQSDGTFSVPTTSHVQVTAPGYVDRAYWLARGTTIDLVPTGAPFDEAFYNQLARGDAEGARHGTRRVTGDPTFVLSGATTAEAAIITAAIVRAVPEWTAGLYHAQFADSANAIRVQVLDSADAICGATSFTGRTIDLYRGHCGCPGVRDYTVYHEVGHAMGFSHVTDTGHVMRSTSPVGCLTGVASDKERWHAALVYHRPNGNLAPDADPQP